MQPVAKLLQRVAAQRPMVMHTLRRALSATTKTQSVVGAHGDEYIIPAGALEAYERDGYIILRNFLTPEELAPIEEIYMKFMRREIEVPGKDFCDMSGGFDRKFEEYAIVNAMLPRKYHPPLAGNIYERRAASVVKQLFRDAPMGIDYDQLLDKNPGKTDAVFAWHQDMAYWPPAEYTPDTRTATFSLALDATNELNGALKFIPGSHKAKVVRPHVPIGKNRDDAHAVAVQVDEEKEPIAMAKLGRGDVSIHNEYVVHGSGGNYSRGHRRTYVLAFRTAATIAIERSAGFDHSHNSEANWDNFREKMAAAAARK